MSELVQQPLKWIATSADLAECLAPWRAAPMLAVDTEFMRSQTYYPIAGLIQINDGQVNYLIDPVGLSDLSPLQDVLFDSSIIKALHACSEDLEVFHRLFGGVPENIFDTQIAAAYAGYGFSVGFANLVKVVLSAELPKAETRSDWLLRPLSEAQIRYAALDVEYLFPLAVQLRQSLAQSNRLVWMREDCARLADNFFASQNPELSYLRNKAAWKLKPALLAILRALSRWREETAQRRDVPRNRVIKEQALFEMAQQRPETMSQLRGIDGLTERMIRADGQALLRLIRENRHISVDKLPVAVPRPLPSSHPAVKILREKVQLVAEKFDIPSELLVRKKDYDLLLRMRGKKGLFTGLPEVLSGWRKSIVGDMLLETLNSLPDATFSTTQS